MRPAILAALVTLYTVLPAVAQDNAKPNTLTPQEIADGWILLFDGASTFGWNGEVKVAEEALQLDKDLPLQHFTTFVSFELDFEYLVAGNKAQLVTLGLSPSEFIALHVDPTSKSWHRAILRFVREGQNVWSGGGRFFSDLRPATKPVGEFKQKPTKLGKEQNTVQFHTHTMNTLSLRNVKLKPLNQEKVFNGKDLTGWREFPGKKSKFTVVDGAITVTDGPGDLQTEKKYGDFVLQLECKSNGKHLNSGIFFRCRADEYQNGYEAQIRNEFTDGPKQKYTVEEFDPKTHELVGKKEVMSPAVDFGTGAIYRRVPARKAVAKDGEWFTLTVVAQGNHIATWVNGLQQVDWTDNRPLSDNARTGCRLEAGHISIQGHDPTTNLSFRNIRIAELPKAE